MSFQVTAVLAVALGCAWLAFCRGLPRRVVTSRAGGYGALVRDGVFMRYALSQAFTLGGLLVFVFGAPAVITGALGGTIRDFIVMQVTGISFFIAGANTTGRAVARFGAERMITGGTILYAAGAVGLLAYALAGGRSPGMLAFLFIPLNLGLGLRGPPGFYRALLASRGDDARGAALVILLVLLTAAAGTALLAPLIAGGLIVLAAGTSVISLAAVGSLFWLPRLEE